MPAFEVSMMWLLRGNVTVRMLPSCEQRAVLSFGLAFAFADVCSLEFIIVVLIVDRTLSYIIVRFVRDQKRISWQHRVDTSVIYVSRGRAIKKINSSKSTDGTVQPKYSSVSVR